MLPSHANVSALRGCWTVLSALADELDYVLLEDLGGPFAARSKAGLPALVLPLASLESNVAGRRGSGVELVGHPSAQFVHKGREWNGPAAALLCTNLELLDTFAVLAADIAGRSVATGVSWASIVALVEEWQALLAPKGSPSIEQETGLWGELCFVEASTQVGRLLTGWRGPEREAADFFVDGVAAEVKTSRLRRQHHVSRTQVDAPAGTHPAWFLSMWVKPDPAATATVPVLVDRILARAPDCCDALRRIVRAGYSPTNRSLYERAFIVVDEPEWYAVDTIPQVRAVDPGISHLRYRVVLDETRRADATVAARLWAHFLGTSHWSGGR